MPIQTCWKFIGRCSINAIANDYFLTISIFLACFGLRLESLSWPLNARFIFSGGVMKSIIAVHDI